MKKKSSKKLHSEFAKNLQFFYQKPTKIFDIYNMRKNLSIFFKRIIYLVAIFLVYTIVNFSMNLVGANDFGAFISWLTCWNRSNPVSPYKGILSDD